MNTYLISSPSSLQLPYSHITHSDNMAPTNLVINGRHKHLCCVVWVARKGGINLLSLLLFLFMLVLVVLPCATVGAVVGVFNFVIIIGFDFILVLYFRVIRM